MKTPWIKYFPILVAVMLFISCGNNKNTTNAGKTDPVLTSTPKLKAITEQIVKAPKDASLYYERGTMLQHMRLDTFALKDYKMASSLDTNNAEYYSTVGDLLFDNKDLTGSVEWIKKAIAKDPKDRKSHLKIANVFLYIREYPKAIEEIDKVLRQDVYNPEAYFLKGMVYKESKDTARAISAFETSVQVAPDYRKSVIQLGLLYSAKKDPIALKYLDNAYRLDSSDVFPLYAQGVYYQNTGDEVMAKAQYRRCILKNDHYFDAYFNMGYLLLQDDSLEKAYRQYDIVTKVDPANSTAYYDRGVCSEHMNKLKDAVNDYRQAALLDTGYKSPKAALARLHVKL